VRILIELLNEEIEKLIEYKKNVESSIVKKVISKAIIHIREEIMVLERREFNEKHFTSIEVNNEQIKLPSGMNVGTDNTDWFVENGVIYGIRRNGWDKDGSFHFHSYVWFKDQNKYVRLTIRTLGADRFGDRIFVDADYFKTENDSYSYLTKRVNSTGKYKEYINKVIFKLREKEGLENFFK
jgi:hypothetical protein